VPSAAADRLRELIAAEGPLRFDRYLEVALYGEAGFYATTGRAGRRGGHFITSPEVGPLFGAVLARALDAWWDDLGRPDPFTVVDAGAGPGTLARAVRAARPRCLDAMRHVAVEVSAAQRALHPAEVESRPDLPGPGVIGVVVANELLDNLPFRLLVFDGRWREATVAVAADRFVEVLVDVEDLPSWVPPTAPHGARIPWQQVAGAWVAQARATLVRGRVLAIDYVTPRTADLAAAPWRTWLRTYRAHERGGHYLAAPGEQDVTAQVALDQLPVPDGVRTQSQFLQRWGIDELVDEGRRAWDLARSRPDVAAMAMRSRVREAEALLDPDGLGGFLALEWLAGA